MVRTYKLALFISVIAIAALACSFGAEDSGSTGGGADILFEDDFSNPESGWDRFNDGEGYTDYENGTYKIGVYTDTLFYWANPYRNFNDVIIEVQAQKITGGDDMQYGIICRHEDVDNWYAMIISGDGYAAIRKRYQGSELEFITDWAQVSAINTGNAANNLRAECIGNQISLYVNGTLAVSVVDSDLTSGDAGLMAGTFEQTSTEVLFDNFVVRKP
ncbi:MAG: hypothetical protein JW757_03745 [Anaerolineales bacterium]|nr:hypothetical protein [Anaerolineales bacterium]